MLWAATWFSMQTIREIVIVAVVGGLAYAIVRACRGDEGPRKRLEKEKVSSETSPKI